MPDWLQKHVDNVYVEGEQYIGVRDFLSVNNIQNEFNIFLSELLNEKVKVVRNWINFTIPGTDNYFNWHDDLHRKGKALGVMWIKGDVDSGGDFWYMDDESMMHSVKFQPNKMITFPRHWIHKVESYTGKIPRIALNFTYV
jgi:hypothetical protein